MAEFSSVISKRLLEEGANVIAADITLQNLKNNEFGVYKDQFLKIEMDITNKESIEKAFEFALSKFGKIDSAINTSYPKGSEYGKHFFDVSYDSFTENLSLHVGGFFLFMQICAKYSLSSNQKFSLLNFSSIYGNIAPRFEIYENTDMTTPVENAAMKSAIQHLSQYISAYTKNSKFRVNCISPGGISDNQDAKFLAKYKKFSREKGMLDVEDLLGTVLYLISESSEYVCVKILLLMMVLWFKKIFKSLKMSSKQRVVIIDRKNANINSLKNAIQHVSDFHLSVSSDMKEIQKADFLVLAGVGAFGDGMADLIKKDLVDGLINQALIKKKAFSWHMFRYADAFSESEEKGINKGLNLIEGKVKYLDLDPSYRIPHVGWNNIEYEEDKKIFNGLGPDKNFYFVHNLSAQYDEKI